MQANGNTHILEKNQTLLDFLQSQGYNLYTIAVELNGEIIPRNTFKDTFLQDDDVLEIVKFVGGG